MQYDTKYIDAVRHEVDAIRQPSLPPVLHLVKYNQDNGGNVSEADTAEIEDGADDVAAGDVTAGLDDDSVLGGGGGGGGEEDGGRYDSGGAGGGGDGAGGGDDENMLDMTGPMDPVAMVPQVSEYERISPRSR